jgi:short-subunit dehydrogenase
MAGSPYAVVTGSSRGIGRRFAHALAARSRDLVLVARPSDDLDQLADELRAEHDVTVVVVAADLAEPGAAGEVAKTIFDQGLEVDLLVNNAALVEHGAFDELSSDAHAHAIRLNVVALVEITRALLPPMLERRRGGIVNVSSISGFQPMPYFAVYAATKAFVTSFSLALAEEVRPSGVAVVTLCPGPTLAQTHHDGDFRSKVPPQPADEVVAAALAQLEEKGGGLLIPRLINKTLVFGNRFLPYQLSAKIAGRAMRPRDH